MVTERAGRRRVEKKVDFFEYTSFCTSDFGTTQIFNIIMTKLNYGTQAIPKTQKQNESMN